MGAAEVISFEEVHARKQWDHPSCASGSMHADQWLDTSKFEKKVARAAVNPAEVTSTVWDLRQQLSGALTETVVAHVHRGEHQR